MCSDVSVNFGDIFIIFIKDENNLDEKDLIVSILTEIAIKSVK